MQPVASEQKKKEGGNIFTRYLNIIKSSNWLIVFILLSFFVISKSVLFLLSAKYNRFEPNRNVEWRFLTRTSKAKKSSNWQEGNNRKIDFLLKLRKFMWKISSPKWKPDSGKHRNSDKNEIIDWKIAILGKSENFQLENDRYVWIIDKWKPSIVIFEWVWDLIATTANDVNKCHSKETIDS